MEPESLREIRPARLPLVVAILIDWIETAKAKKAKEEREAKGEKVMGKKFTGKPEVN